MDSALTIFTDLWGQMGKLPIAALLAIVIIAVGVTLKKLAVFPNKFIPVVTLLLGTFGYAFLGDPGKISPTQRYPQVILGFYGTILGFVTWGAHKFLLKKLEKFLPEGFFPSQDFNTDPPFPKEDKSNVKPKE